MHQDRRTFLATLSAATLGVVAGSRPAAAATVPVRTKLSRIGIQLYTVRGVAAKDLAGTLGQLAKIGYKEVEFAGYHNHSAAEVRDMLKRTGLTAPSAHIAKADLESSPAKTFDDAKTVGIEWITVPYLPEPPKTVDGWKRLAAEFNTLAGQAKRAGFRFAFHNHNTEIKKVGTATPLEILIAETDPALVFFEMDLYWVVNAGASPVDLLTKHAGRIKMLHVKDSKGAPDHKMADVGAGTIDFKTIFARAKGIEHYFVEHDEPTDAMASAAASYKYLSNLEF